MPPARNVFQRRADARNARQRRLCPGVCGKRPVRVGEVRRQGQARLVLALSSRHVAEIAKYIRPRERQQVMSRHAAGHASRKRSASSIATGQPQCCASTADCRMTSGSDQSSDRMSRGDLGFLGKFQQARGDIARSGACRAARGPHLRPAARAPSPRDSDRRTARSATCAASPARAVARARGSLRTRNAPDPSCLALQAAGRDPSFRKWTASTITSEGLRSITPPT